MEAGNKIPCRKQADKGENESRKSLTATGQFPLFKPRKENSTWINPDGLCPR
jgi:hypothetical protein